MICRWARLTDRKNSREFSGSAKVLIPTRQQDFVSFDGNIRAQGQLQRPDRYRYWQPQSFASTAIPRGAGLSYAAASFRHGGLSVEHTCFNRILGLDSAAHRVEVEAGISLAEIYDFLASRGLYLPIQPGHGRITVGGCIAADVHGKNQARDGTFIKQVESLTLFHPDHGTLELSRNKNPTLFRLTCGGYGLTGHIISAQLSAKPLPSTLLEFDCVPADDVLGGIRELHRTAQHSDFTFSWHDFAMSRLGPGFVQSSRFVSGNEKNYPAPRLIGEPPVLSAASRCRWRISLLNPLTIWMMNRIYWLQVTMRSRPGYVELRDALFPIHQTQSYFKLFGNRGFHEYQIIIPTAGIEEFCAMLREHLSHHRSLITLASAKLFRGDPELLRFTGDGICFTLNFPRDNYASRLLTSLDEFTTHSGAKPNIIKDSRLPRVVVEATYPGITQFRTLLREFDPKRRFQSELSVRLGL